jgi:hypothetical protein
MAWLRHKLPEAFKLQPAYDAQLSELRSGRTEIRCRHLRSSEWGFLDEYHRDGRKQPIWILYVQLDIKQPPKNKLKYATMSLDFEPKTRGSEGVIVTNYYGPKHIRGSLVTRVIHHKAGLNPRGGAGPFTFEVGAWERGSTQERTERWHFDAMSKPGRVGDNRFRRIDWTITEARHALDPNHNPEWNLGVVLTHDGKDFMIHPDISISFINAYGILRLLPIKERTRTDVTPPQQELKDWRKLDDRAKNLPLDLLNYNLPEVATAKQD